jgi:hypothetical protein
MYALTNAPAHLIIPVKAFGIGVYADPEDVVVPNALRGGQLTRFSDGKNTHAFNALIGLLRDLGYTVVTRIDP